jgi:hypothetical protein
MMRRYYLSSHSSGSRPAHNLSAKGDRRSGLNRWKWVGGNLPKSSRVDTVL